MSDAAARNLIDIEFYRTHVETGEDNPNMPEELIEQYITAATDAIELRCGRNFIKASGTVDEIFDGTGEINYYVRQGRINSATTPVIAYWSNDQWNTAGTTTYPRDYDYDAGEVYFTNHQTFWLLKKGWKITYQYGWTNIAALPFDLKAACADLVKWMRMSSDKQGIVSESFGDSSTSYAISMNRIIATEWPIQITALLDRYKVVQCG